MIPPVWIEKARRRLDGRIVQTPLTFDPQLNIYLKWENRQKTGSFKIRGALNKVLGLDRPALAGGLVTASAGNHGQGVAVSARLAETTLVVFVFVVLQIKEFSTITQELISIGYQQKT